MTMTTKYEPLPIIHPHSKKKNVKICSTTCNYINIKYEHGHIDQLILFKENRIQYGKCASYSKIMKASRNYQRSRTIPLLNYILR